MSRFWDFIIHSRGWQRFHSFPFLLALSTVRPVYQAVSRHHLQKREHNCSRVCQAALISVGNVSVGGTGKTPLTIWLAEYFVLRGKRVAIVHSGYGRESKTPTVYSSDSGKEPSAAFVGDEVAMMTRRLPQTNFAVGPDKKALVAMADHEFQPDIIILDDGFQRRDIEKDIEIACEAAPVFSLPGDRFLKRTYRLFPAGMLREPVANLERADAICCLTAGSPLDDTLITRWKTHFGISRPVLGWRIGCREVVCDGRVLPVEEISDKKPYLFAGIGSFERLLEMVSGLPVEITGNHQFDDHFVYDHSDLDMIRDMANDTGADCYLTTEKDVVKFPDYTFDRPVYALRLAVSPIDSAAVDAVLKKVL